MPSIGTVVADLILNSASFISNFQKAADSTARNTKRMANDLASLRGTVANAESAVKGFIGAFATIATVQSFVRLGQSAINMADEIEGSAKRIGASAEDLQRFRLAAELANVSTSELEAALKVFGARLSKGELTASQSTLTGALNEYIARIAEAPSFLQKAQIATEAFGRQWQIGIALAAEGAAKFAENAKGAATISGDLTRKADAIGDAFTKVRDAVAKGFVTGFLLEFGKGMEGGAESIAAFVKVAQFAGGELARMGNDIVGFAKSVKEVFDDVKTIINAVVGIIDTAAQHVRDLVAEIGGLWTSIPSWARPLLTAVPGVGAGAAAMNWLTGPGGKAAAGGPLRLAGPNAGTPATPFSFPQQKDPFATPKPWQDWPQFQAEFAAAAAKIAAAGEASDKLAAGADKAGGGLDKLGADVGGVGAAADIAGSGLGTFGQDLVETGRPLKSFEVSVVGADRHLGSFGDGLSSTSSDLDEFGDGLRSATSSFGQFSAGLGGFGNGLGTAGLGLNSFNTGIGGLIQTTGFTSMSLGALGKAADLSRIDVQSALAGSRDAFMRGAGYLNDMSKAGLMLTNEFLTWQAELRSRRVIVNESGQFQVAPAFGPNAQGDFSAVFALQKRNRERVAAAQAAQEEEKAAKAAAKLKQKELEKELVSDDFGVSGGVTAGRNVPSVHITLEGSDATRYTRDQVMALMEQMGEAIGDGARISIS